MQDLDKIPKWKIKLGQNSHAETAAGNAETNTEDTAASSANGFPWLSLILGSLLIIGIYTNSQNQKDDIKK